MFYPWFPPQWFWLFSKKLNLTKLKQQILFKTFLDKELTPKIHKCTFSHSLIYFLIVYFKPILLAATDFKVNVAHSSVPLALHPLGLAFLFFSSLDFTLAPFLSQEGRVRFGERKARRWERHFCSSFSLPAALLLGKVYILLIYNLTTEPLFSSRQFHSTKDWRWITSVMLPQISWEQWGSLAWEHSFLSSDGYRSKTRMKQSWAIISLTLIT